MPLIIPQTLPAYKALEEENVFVMHRARAMTQDIRPLRILLVNLMPTKIATETQIARMLANSPLQVELTLLHMDSHESTHVPGAHLEAFYKTFDEIKTERFDGMIVTGAPVEMLAYEEVDYWPELCAIFEYSKTHVYSTVHICWGAQAALYYHYGIHKRVLPQKVFGIFAHRVTRPKNPLVRGFDEVFYAPHSRHTELCREEVDACPALRVLAESGRAGLHIRATDSGRQIFVCGHMGIGARAMVSQFNGAGDAERLKATIDTIYTALIVGIVPLSIVGILVSRPIIALLAVPADTADQCWIYMVIVLGGLIGSLGYNANSGILQGLGDSKTPLLFLVIACIINIVLDLLFVVVFHWGVAGVAIATIIAQAFSWIFGIFYINKKYPQIHIHPFCFKFDKALFGQIVKLGVPAGVQQALFSFGVMAMQRLINSYGSAFMAGFNGANKLDTFAFMPIQSFATAATTFVGQNIGANRPERVHKGTVATLWMSCGFSVLVAVLLLPTGRFCMRLFSTEPAVIESGFAYLARILPFYWMLAIMFVLSSIMRGAGEMMVPMISSLAALWLARVPAAYLLAHFFGPMNIHFCYAIGWALGLAICVPYYFSGRWKEKSIVVRAAGGS